MRKFLLGLLLATLSVPGMAAELSVSHAWIRLLPGQLPLAGYARMVNRGKQPVTLIAASSPAFTAVQFHRSINRNGMDEMVHLKSLRIAAGQTLNFAPGGYHLMLMGRQHALQPGEEVAITFKYADGSHQTVHFVVKGVAGK